MKCRRAKALIFDFIDGVIGDQDRVSLERHLGECQACDDMAKSLTESLDLLHAMPQEEPSENFNWKVRLGITQARNAAASDPAVPRSWLRSWNLRFVMSAAATFVFVAGSGYILLRSDVVPKTVNLADGRGAPAVEVQATPAESAEGRTFVDPTGPGAGSPYIGDAPLRATQFGLNPVSGGGEPGQTSAPEPLIGESRLDFDSLTTHFRETRGLELQQRNQVWRLEEQIEALQGQLSECDKGDR